LSFPKKFTDLWNETEYSYEIYGTYISRSGFFPTV